MPLVGLVRGFGEAEAATGYIIKLTKALRRRFDTKIQLVEVPVGNYEKYGCSLTQDVIAQMRNCDCVYVGDMKHGANSLEFGVEDIAMCLDNNIEYTCIQGLDEKANINVNIVSYFDGGYSLRDGHRDTEGCTELKICSTFSVMNIVKSVTRQCEERRRRLVFVKDGENEYCANLFASKFSDFTMPLSNFNLIKYTTRDIAREILCEPGMFDTIFASKTFAEYATGVYSSVMGHEFTAYRKFTDQRRVYTVDAIESNSPTKEYTPSLSSYIMAFSDMLKNEFSMDKEAAGLNHALKEVCEKGISPENGDVYIEAIIEELKKPLNGVYKRRPVNTIRKLK